MNNNYHNCIHAGGNDMILSHNLKKLLLTIMIYTYTKYTTLMVQMAKKKKEMID